MLCGVVLCVGLCCVVRVRIVVTLTVRGVASAAVQSGLSARVRMITASDSEMVGLDISSAS